MHAVDTEKGKPVQRKSEKEVLDIANTIITENGLEEYEDVMKRGALLANVSFSHLRRQYTSVIDI
jgi:hypothetical protein